MWLTMFCAIYFDRFSLLLFCSCLSEFDLPGAGTLLGGCRSIGDIGEMGCILAVLHKFHKRNSISLSHSQVDALLFLPLFSPSQRFFEWFSPPRRTQHPSSSNVPFGRLPQKCVTKNTTCNLTPIPSLSICSRHLPLIQTVFMDVPEVLRPAPLRHTSRFENCSTQNTSNQTSLFILSITTACQPVAELGLQCWVRVKLCI